MAATLEERMAALEREIERLKQRPPASEASLPAWWKPFVGAFENDPLFEQAIRSGREYRQSLQPREDSDGEDGT